MADIVKNIDVEIDNKIVIVYGKMGSGKTAIAILLGARDYKERIYSNVNIFDKGKQLNKIIDSKKSIENIRFSFTPGLIIIDEGGINMNSRQSMSQVNQFLSEVIFLSRKKNCSMIFISQRFESLDVNIRALADLILKMKKLVNPFNRKPIFVVERQKQIQNKLMTIRQFKIDTIKTLQFKKIEYDTLESSKIDFKEEFTAEKYKKKLVKKKE